MNQIASADVGRLRELPCQHCFHKKTCIVPSSLRSIETMPLLPPMAIHQSVYVKRQRIIGQSSDMTAFYIIKSGSAKTVQVDPNGEERITAFHLAGETAGWEGIEHHQMPSSIIALEKTTVCRISISAMETIAQSNSDICQRVVQQISEQLNSQNTLSRWLAQYTAEQRVVALIENLSERFTRSHLQGDSFRLPMNRTDIANHLGLAVETVSRILSRLQKQGDITIRGKDIRIFNLHTAPTAHSKLHIS